MEQLVRQRLRYVKPEAKITVRRKVTWFVFKPEAALLPTV
jgi:hypothetical protein